MEPKTIISLARMLCGTAIVITHMVTGANSTFVLVGLGLLGIPVELVSREKKEG